jgi:CTP synthase (UTP-ammonia lyase)
MTRVIIEDLLVIYLGLITILIAPSNLDLNANIRYGSPPHVDERHRHRYEVCHDL